MRTPHVHTLTILAMILISILIAGCAGKQPQPSEDRPTAQQQKTTPSDAQTDHANQTITNPTEQPKETNQNDRSQTRPASEPSGPHRSDTSMNRTPETPPVAPSEAPALQPVTNRNDTASEATTEATTEIQPITDLPVQKPNAPDQPSNIWESLSPQEIDCLPESIHDDQSLIHAMDDNQQNPLAAQQITQCLTDENAFILHMTAASGETTGVSEETQRCIWKAVNILAKVDSTTPPSPDNSNPLAEFEHFMKVIIGTAVITGYCMSDQEWAIINPIDTNKERDYTICIVDSYGGPEQFLEALIEDITSLELAEAICDYNNQT